jgi:hypothetical protein
MMVSPIPRNQPEAMNRQSRLQENSRLVVALS